MSGLDMIVSVILYYKSRSKTS